MDSIQLVDIFGNDMDSIEACANNNMGTVGLIRQRNTG